MFCRQISTFDFAHDDLAKTRAGIVNSEDDRRIDHFDVATRVLLEKIVHAAGLVLENQPGKAASKTKHSVAVLEATISLCRAYLECGQLQAAQERLGGALAPEEERGSAIGLSKDAFKFFRADAAKPESWSSVVHASVDSLADEAFSERWLMAQDCLYHLSPSRKSIFKFAAKTLDANVMAFDLILNENASMWQTMAVRLLGFVLSCPLYTFLTAEQYRNQLIECGYDQAQIEIRDISDHVFDGLSGHLRKQEVALSRYGISLAGYSLTGRVFAWFDRTRVVGAAIVIGRTKRMA
ncbi:hypothetical protein J3458_019069 [Metarhizium acridum]|uniref:uncharacterized protein n=1 Tax=Metarhizium acridum TaxID=92637 RepID=UPI001C6C87AB|nr:hypothetical protein J3458_019069 [Metarhizium acridum]